LAVAFVLALDFTSVSANEDEAGGETTQHESRAIHEPAGLWVRRRAQERLDIRHDDEEYVKDCTVCCRPIVLRVGRDENGQLSVSASMESE
jgi:hypothetical protein